jgi:DNA-binding NtrC family response regulator
MKEVNIITAADNAELNLNLSKLLFASGYCVREAKNRDTLLTKIKREKPDLVIIGSTKEDGNGLDQIQNIHQYDASIPLIFVTKHSSERQAIHALRAGVSDYFKIPFSSREFQKRIQCIVTSRLGNPRYGEFDVSIIGDSQKMRRLKAYISKVAKTDSTVFICGETGTGKELVAQLIHQRSPRSDKPFICLNCAALPENLLESELFGHERGAFTGAISTKCGKFEIASGGSIFLDEISDLSLLAQAKILRVVETKKAFRVGGRNNILMDSRIITATNQDPERLVNEKMFREDLYYRLNVAQVHLPSLRDRREDIPLLINYFVRQFNGVFGTQIKGFSDRANSALMKYHWPGNVRELKNLIEAAYINLPHRKVEFIDLPEIIKQRLKHVENLSENERRNMLQALSETNWNKSRAAEKLQWSRMTLYRKLRKYRIVEQPNDNA